jgi:glycosyltransferase involved in cell wall biosynthesis
MTRSVATDLPDVTVVMSVLNGADFVQEAVDSILSQSLTNFEFIIINDGSTDETLAVLEGFADPRIRIFSNARSRGLSASLNLGISHSRGRHIARLDADDVAEPERLQQQLDFLDRNPDVGLIGSWYRNIAEAGDIQDVVYLPTDHVDILWAMLFYSPFAHSAIMFRKNVAEGYNERFRYSMDYELCLRVASSHKVCNLPEPLVRVRQNSSSMTATFGDAREEGSQLRAKLITDLLGWDRLLDTVERQRRIGAMYKLLRVEEGFENIAELEKTVQDSLELHKAFCAKWALHKDVANAHRRFLKGWIARKLVRLAKINLDKRQIISFLRVVGLALRVDPVAVFRKGGPGASQYWRI